MNMKIRESSGRIAIAMLLFTLFGSGSISGKTNTDPYANETPEQRAERMQWWSEGKFGLFIHWGIYAHYAGLYQGERKEGLSEHILRSGEIPVAEYREVAGTFNPTNYDPEFWADLALEAGCSYVIITAKHHDGFAMFPSDVTDWDVADASAYKKDLIQPLATAVRARGLKFGLYYSQAQDWVHPGGAKGGYSEEGWDPAHRGDYDEYLKTIALPQVEELFARYDPAVFWWDTAIGISRERADPFNGVLSKYPGVITNNRLGGGYDGDTQTPEQRVPQFRPKAPYWETCMTLTGDWGYSLKDTWKSESELIRQLVEVASKGGNFLLNIGPGFDGSLRQQEIDRLRGIGRWMKTNSEAIYGSSPSPMRIPPQWGHITTKAIDDSVVLYLNVFEWPKDGELVVPVNNEVVSCTLLGDDSRTFGILKGVMSLPLWSVL